MPEGVAVQDAAVVVPRDRVVACSRGPGRGSSAACADLFRDVLLDERGRWRVDADQIGPAPFDFRRDYVFSREGGGSGDGAGPVTNGVFKAPAGSEAIRSCRDVCERKDPATVAWGELGPALLRTAVLKFGLQASPEPPQTFLPIPLCRSRSADPAVGLPPDRRGPPERLRQPRRASRQRDAASGGLGQERADPRHPVRRPGRPLRLTGGRGGRRTEREPRPSDGRFPQRTLTKRCR